MKYAFANMNSYFANNLNGEELEKKTQDNLIFKNKEGVTILEFYNLQNGLILIKYLNDIEVFNFHSSRFNLKDIASATSEYLSSKSATHKNLYLDAKDLQRYQDIIDALAVYFKKKEKLEVKSQLEKLKDKDFDSYKSLIENIISENPTLIKYLIRKEMLQNAADFLELDILEDSINYAAEQIEFEEDVLSPLYQNVLLEMRKVGDFFEL